MSEGSAVGRDGTPVAPVAPVVPVTPVTPSVPASQSVEPQVLNRTLWISIKDGVAWSVMVGAGERYVSAFIILGQAGLTRIAGMHALPGLVGAVVQCFAADIVDAAGRRRPFCAGSAAAQALTWVPFCAGMFLPPAIGYWLMLASFALYIGFANFGAPAWNSMMGELVPADRRGRYFGLRNGVIGAGLIVSSLAAGAWVTYGRDRPGLAHLGLSSLNFAFLTVFAVAMLARLVSAYYLHQMHEPPYQRHPSDHFTLLDFIRRAPRAHFGRFVFYCMGLNAGVGFIGPFFFWYILAELHFSPLAFAAIGAINWLANYGSSIVWGHVADRVGNKRVLAIGGIGLALVPLLLLVSDHFWWFAIAQAYDGIVTSAFSIASANYLFDVVTVPKRARCSAYNALFGAAGTAVGTFGAALVATCTPLPLHVAGVTIGHPFVLLCLGSALLRLLPSLLLLGSFQEFRLQRPVFATQGTTTL